MLLIGASTTSASDTLKIDLREKGTDVYYLDARLGGDMDTELLFDTGSGYLALNEHTLNQLKARSAARYQRSIHARMASGRVRKVDVYTISSLRLGEDCVLRDVEAAELPGNTRNILGMNVLRRAASFSVSFQPARLSLSGCERAPPTLAQVP